MKGITLSLLVLVFLAILFLIGYFVTKPKYDLQYFDTQCLRKYNNPEATFSHYVNSLRTGDPNYYQEVLGRKIGEKGKRYITKVPYRGKDPKIIRKVTKKDYVYIITENNWGVNLEKVHGRWVFSPEDIGFLYRELFRLFGL